MNTDEIHSILSKALPKDVFIGVFDATNFPVMEKAPYCFVINQDPLCKPGTHWCSVYVNSNREPYYFDPFGHQPHYHRWMHFLAASSHTGFWDYNKLAVQPLSSQNCGHFNIYFLVKRFREPSHVSNFNIISSASDQIVVKFVKMLDK